MKRPETRYARSGDVAIAYQVAGEGPLDVVFVPGTPTTIESFWDDHTGPFFSRLASFCRLIPFDKRGTGLSDRTAGIPDLETRMDDVRAVLDAVGAERAAIVGASDGGPLSIVFAATYPERAQALVLYGSAPRFTRTTDFPFGPTPEEWRRMTADEVERWATIELARDWLGPQADEKELERTVAAMRTTASPGAWRDLMVMNADVDVRGALSSIRVPTLVLHRTSDPAVPVGAGRWMAERIPGATLVELPGEREPHPPAEGNWQAVTDEIERFLQRICDEGRAAPEPETMLATVLFTDIVGSTARAAELGDRAWRELLERHHASIRHELARFRGVELDTAGDGFFARFDGPARAIRCACAVRDAVAELGLEVRAGLHAGECELLDDKVTGIAVAIGARVAAQARPGEVLASQTVKDLVAGSGIGFDDRGLAALTGVPGEWRLFAVENV